MPGTHKHWTHTTANIITIIIISWLKGKVVIPLRSLKCWVHKADPCNPISYLGVWDREDHSLRATWANSLRDPISKVTRKKFTGCVAQVVEYLLCKCKALDSNPSLTGKKVWIGMRVIQDQSKQALIWAKLAAEETLRSCGWGMARLH
jgi:hypothetical protein